MSQKPSSRIVDHTDIEARLQRIQELAEPPVKRRPASGGMILMLGFLLLQLVSLFTVLTLVLSSPSDSADPMAALKIPTMIEPAAPPSQPPPPPPVDPFQNRLAVIPEPTSPNRRDDLPLDTPLTQLKLRGVELTQGIQVFQEPEHLRCDPNPAQSDYIFCNNSIPMVADRHTLVRVYLACQENCPTTDTMVDLRLLKDGQEQAHLTRSLPAEALQRLHNLSLPDLRANLEHSVNFEFFPPPAWMTGQVTLVVEARPQASTLPPAALTLTKEFATRKPLRIAYLPIEYKGHRPPDSAEADHWLLRMYPVPAVEYYRLPMPEIVWEGELNKGEILRKLLYTYWYYAQYPSVGSHLPDQLFGWLPQEFYNGGASDPFWCPNCSGPHSSRVAFGGFRPEPDIGAPRILVHEIAHNFGARHAWSPTNREDSGCFKAEGVDIQVDPEWPYSQEPNIQEFGIDLYSDPPVIYPPSYYDMMAYCTQPWISPHTYRKIFDSPLLQPEAEIALSIPELQPETEPSSQGTLLVSGVVYPDGTISKPEIIQLAGDAFADAAGFTPPPVSEPSSGDEYCVNVHNQDEALLAQHCFTAGFADLETGLPTESSSFLFPIPEIDPAQVGQITISRDEVEVTSVAPSNHPPEIKVTFPESQEPLSGSQTLTWEATDPDGDTLRYDLLYSHDGGRSWLPLAIQLTETYYTFSTGQIPSSSAARFRVVAHDGFHTSMAESGPLSLVLPQNSFSLVGPAVVEPGQSFEVTLVAHDVTDPGLFGVQFKLDFDPQLVQVDEIVGHPALTLVVDRTIQNDTGQLSFVASRQGQADNLSGEITLATLKMRAKTLPGQLSLKLHSVAAGARGGVPLPLAEIQGLSLRIGPLK